MVFTFVVMLFLIIHRLLVDTQYFFLMPSFMFLFLENYGVRKLEAVFAVLISTMAVSFACMFAETKPSGKELLTGENKHCLTLYLPSKKCVLFIIAYHRPISLYFC